MFSTTISSETLYFVVLRWTQGYVKISSAYEFEHVVKCGKLQCPSNILGTMWEMQTFVHKYILHLLKPFEILMTSLGTQIMFPSPFVEFLDHTKMLLELLYHKHDI